MRSRLEPLVRRARAEWALNWSATYPQELPDPPLAPMNALDTARIEGLQTVCIFLGPYRNLTSLTASVLFLHPECQVLNHAGARVLNNPELNFLNGYSEDKFRQFCHFALTMSQGGARGGYGGSIVLSHAFAEHAEMRKLYRARYGSRLVKPTIRSLVWKESEMVSSYVREHGVELIGLTRKNPRLRFLLPIRNPLDVSLSIARIGISRFYPQISDGDVRALLKTILEEIKTFLGLTKQEPANFYYFFQNDVSAQSLVALAKFLGLSKDERWINDSLSVYTLKKSYDYEPTLKEFYLEQVERIFSEQPAVMKQMKNTVLAA